MVTTFQDLYEAVLKRGHLAVTDALALPLVKEWINTRYRTWARSRPWTVLLKQGVLSLTAPYTTGTVTTDGTTTVTGSGTAWTSAMVGRRFKRDDFDEVYIISAVPGASELTLNAAFAGDDGSGKTYSIVAPQYSLANDFDRLRDPYRSFAPYKLVPLGRDEMNRRWGFSAETGAPRHYTIFPEESAGVITLKLILHPAPEEDATLYYDYFKALTSLSAAGDQPAIPENYRDILEVGAFADLLQYKDDQRASFYEAMFQQRIAEMAGDYAVTDDVPRFRPADHYRSHYRSSRGGRVDDPWGFDHGIDRR